MNMIERTYQSSHPWITFRADLNLIPYTVWMQLGEVQALCGRLCQVPLAPRTSKALHQIYLAKGVAATTAIEGNTLSEDEVRRHLDRTLKLPPSKEYLGREVENILTGLNLILKTIADPDQEAELTVPLIRDFNRIVLADLELDEGVVPGDLRTHAVGVGSYRGAPAEDCPYLLDRLCAWLPQVQAPQPDDTIAFAVLRALLAHLYLAWIHPFGDGNGRTARLVELLILLKSGVPSPAAHLLSNHYNLTRNRYYRELDRASKSGGDFVPFLGYALQGLLDGLREQMAYVTEQQLTVAWEHYVHELFPGSGRTTVRQRDLLLELSRHPEGVASHDVPGLSVTLARHYEGKTVKTLSRDLNGLKARNLVRRVDHAWAARREIILAFLPAQVREKPLDATGRAPAKARRRAESSPIQAVK